MRLKLYHISYIRLIFAIYSLKLYSAIYFIFWGEEK